MKFISKVEVAGGWDWEFCARAVTEIRDDLLADYELTKHVMPLET